MVYFKHSPANCGGGRTILVLLVEKSNFIKIRSRKELLEWFRIPGRNVYVTAYPKGMNSITLDDVDVCIKGAVIELVSGNGSVCIRIMLKDVTSAERSPADQKTTKIDSVEINTRYGWFSVGKFVM